MYPIQDRIEEWLYVMKNGSSAEQLFTYESIKNQLPDFSFETNESIYQKIFPELVNTIKGGKTPIEIILMIAPILEHLRPHIKDDKDRRDVFVYASNHLPSVYRSISKSQILNSLMLKYQKEENKEKEI